MLWLRELLINVGIGRNVAAVFMLHKHGNLTTTMVAKQPYSLEILSGFQALWCLFYFNVQRIFFSFVNIFSLCFDFAITSTSIR